MESVELFVRTFCMSLLVWKHYQECEMKKSAMSGSAWKEKTENLVNKVMAYIYIFVVVCFHFKYPLGICF